jgi:hypothetical protein
MKESTKYKNIFTNQKIIKLISKESANFFEQNM